MRMTSAHWWRTLALIAAVFATVGGPALAQPRQPIAYEMSNGQWSWPARSS